MSQKNPKRSKVPARNRKKSDARPAARAPAAPPVPCPLPVHEWHGYIDLIGPHGEMVLYQPSLPELLKGRKKQKPPPPILIPGPSIPRHKWQGYRQYTGPHGEMIVYQPSIDELLEEEEQEGENPPAPPQPPVDQPQGGNPPGKTTDAPPKPVDDHPHTVSRPSDPSAPPPKPADTGSDEPAAVVPPDTDVDEEIRRHREWLRHRFDGPPPPPPPDRTKAGTYQRMRDEADETARRIRQLEDERWDSILPDWLWDQLFGGELRLLLVHLRALRWQIEEFEKAWGNGDDPVAAVNRYNREQWEIFLRTLYEHIKLMGEALINIETLRAIQKALEEALKKADAIRRRNAREWLKTRERARAKAEKSPPTEEPPTNPPPGTPPGDGKTGGLSRRNWERLKARYAYEKTPAWSKADKDAARLYADKFAGTAEQESKYGMSWGTVSVSEDGKTITVTVNQFSPDGVPTPGPVTVIPAADAPVNIGIPPGETWPYAITNSGPP